MALLAVAGAMLACARGRLVWVVGFALGVAGACQPWAIVAAPILLALPPRRMVSGTLAFVEPAAVWWLPFVVAAPGTVTARPSVVAAGRRLGPARGGLAR
jgi:hypothetical protein